MHPHHFSAYFILFFIFIQNNFINSKELRFTDIHFDPSLNVGSNLTDDKIIRKIANNHSEAIEKAKSGIFYFEVKGEVTYDDDAMIHNSMIHEYEMTTGTGFCTVYQDKIYFITREKLIKFRTRYHKQDLIRSRYYLEGWAMRNNARNTRYYCESREKPQQNKYKFEVKIVAKSNTDGKWLHLKIENIMQHNDLAILSFEEENEIDPRSCLKFEESGELPPKGKVQTFIRNGEHSGTVVEGKVEKSADNNCKSVFTYSFPTLQTSVHAFKKNSGSPLLNESGEVVGIDGETDVSQTMIGKTLSRIIQNHHVRKKSALYHFKGVDLEFSRHKSDGGVLVLVSNNKIFERGDRIKQCNGVPIDDLKSLNELLLFQSYNKPSFQIRCNMSRGDQSVQVDATVNEMEANQLTEFHKRIHCGDSPTPEYDSNTLRGKNIGDYLIFGLNVDCEKVLNRTVNYANPLEKTIEEVRSTSLLIKSTVSVTLENKETTCHLMSGSAFITKQNNNYYVVSNQHVILSKNDVTSPVMKLCVDHVKDLINRTAIKDSICNDTNFKFDANFIVRAKTRNEDEFILKNPVKNVNSIKMLDVVVTTFLNETIPPGFLEFANDAPKLNDDVISVGNQIGILQTFSVGKVTEDSKKIHIGYFGTRYAINIWTHGGNSGAAIVRAKDRKVIGLDGLGLNERTHSLTTPFLHKLVKSFDRYKKIMVFHPVGVGLKWNFSDRNEQRAEIFKKMDMNSTFQPLQVKDVIVKINNENISNPDDIVIASTIAAAENLQEISINNEVRYVSYVTMKVHRNGRNMTLGNVPIADLSYAELDEIDKIITGIPRFDFIPEVRKQVCGNNMYPVEVTMNPTPKQTTKTVNKVTMNSTPKQTTKTVKKPGLKPFATSNNPKIYTFSTPFTSTISTPYETDNDLFSKPIIDTDAIYTTPLLTYSNSKYNSLPKPSSSNHKYVIAIKVVCILFGIAIFIFLIMVYRSTKIGIRINCFSKGSSTEDDSFDQSTLNETLKDKIKDCKINYTKTIVVKLKYK